MKAYAKPAWWPELVLAAVLAAASLYHLGTYPALWWDEAIFSETAANLAVHGRYAFTVQSPGQLSDLDYRISVGPTVILPVALAYRLFGVGVEAGRLVAAGFLLLAFAALYLAVRRLWGRAPALTAVVLTLAATDVLYWGRSVLGDIPALALFLLGLRFLFPALERSAAGPLFLGGLLLGLAVNAKEFYGLAVLPPVLLWAAGHRREPRRLLLGVLSLGAGVGLPLLGYLLLKAAILGSIPAALWHFWEQKALLRHEFFTPLTIGRVYPESIAYLVGHPLFWLGAAGFFFLRRREGLSAGGRLWLMQWALWSLMYLTAVYWQRFALPALFLAAGPAAWLLVRLARTLLAPLARRTRALAAGTVAGFALLTFPLSGVDILTAVVRTQSSAHHKLLEFLQARIPCDCLIETPEYELVFLTDEHRIHLMPAFFFVESTPERVVLLNPRGQEYDFNRTGADVLILGSFGKSVFCQVYPPARISPNWRKVAQVDFYDIYVRRGLEQAVLKRGGPMMARGQSSGSSPTAGAAHVSASDHPFPH
jgi:4-amino-4-deoxy-L-arabinose transferase-like glycosyltransferase